MRAAATLRTGLAWWTSRACIGILLFVLAAIGITDAQANVFGADRREYRDADQPLLRSVGLLASARRQVGTAFLIGECHVVTAYHSAFFRDEFAVASGEVPVQGRAGHALDFYLDPDPARPGTFRAHSKARVVDFGKYYPGAPRGMTGDWAILELDDCLGRRYGFLDYLRPEAHSLVPTGPLMTISYPGSMIGRGGVAVEEGCRVRGSGQVVGLLAVDCAFESGMSGGPVLERQTDGVWRVVGIMQLRYMPVQRVLPEYRPRHRNQMVHTIAFFRAADRVLRSPTARTRPPGEDQAVAFEREAIALLARELPDALRHAPGASMFTWRGDLNGDQVDELIVRVCADVRRAPQDCAMHVLARNPEGLPSKAGSLSGIAGPVRLGYGMVNGWRPLLLGGAGGSAAAIFAGTAYRPLTAEEASPRHPAMPSMQGDEILKIGVPLSQVLPTRQ